MVLPRAHRLSGTQVFEKLYRRGRRFESPTLVLRVLPADAALLPPDVRRHAPSPWRCAVVVSAKVSKRAVQRNRLRRLLHNHLLSLEPRPASPHWLLISLRPSSLESEPARLLGECSHLLHLAGMTP